MILTSDFWESVINDERVDRFPDWESIDRSISRLDEKVYTLSSLITKKAQTCLSAGSSGIVVALSSGNEHLIARQGDETKPISVIVGGQAGDYRQKTSFPRDSQKILREHILREMTFER
ncbi:hypothetical protein [Methylosinus trichosporium]|uniref:hypothetical protein n=1 Tax=Methylosinus trichosporium TaxID=426 RepID=UPI0012FFD39C|nr:hypothetical protein [Methylosinus trichosporium]